MVTIEPLGSLAIRRNFNDDALAETHEKVEITGGEFVVAVGPGVVVVVTGAAVVTGDAEMACVVEGVLAPVVTDVTAVVVEVAGTAPDPDED